MEMGGKRREGSVSRDGAGSAMLGALPLQGLHCCPSSALSGRGAVWLLECAN